MDSNMKVCKNCEFRCSDGVGSLPDCPNPDWPDSHTACNLFKVVEENALTMDDFPIKVSKFVVAKFESNKKSSDTLKALMDALYQSAKSEQVDAWAFAINEIPGFKKIHSKIIAKGMCCSYDYVGECITIIPTKR